MRAGKVSKKVLKTACRFLALLMILKIRHTLNVLIEVVAMPMLTRSRDSNIWDMAAPITIEKSNMFQLL